MKIAAIALASATLIALAEPGYAQQNTNRDQSDRMERPQHGSGMQRQFQNDDEHSGTTGRGRDWSDRDEWRDRNSSDSRDGDRMHRRNMHGNMEDRMGAMMRIHERMAKGNEGAAHFHFRRGQAAIDVQCPQGQPVQVCVNAAGQLLDKIANLRDRNAQGATQGMGSDSDTMTSRPGAPLSNQQLDSRKSGGADSGQ